MTNILHEAVYDLPALQTTGALKSRDLTSRDLTTRHQIKGPLNMVSILVRFFVGAFFMQMTLNYYHAAAMVFRSYLIYIMSMVVHRT